MLGVGLERKEVPVCHLTQYVLAKVARRRVRQVELCAALVAPVTDALADGRRSQLNSEELAWSDEIGSAHM